MPDFKKLEKRNWSLGGRFVDAGATTHTVILVPQRLPGKALVPTEFTPAEFEDRMRLEHSALSQLGIPLAPLPRRLPQSVSDKHFDGRPAYIRRGFRDLKKSDLFKQDGSLNTRNVDAVAEVIKKAGTSGFYLDAVPSNFGVGPDGIVLRDYTGALSVGTYHYKDDEKSLKEALSTTKPVSGPDALFATSTTADSFLKYIDVDIAGVSKTEITAMYDYFRKKHGIAVDTD